MRLSAASSNLSDIVLPAAGVLVALLVGLALVWVTYIVGFPKRRLSYALRLVTPLLATGAAKDLELRHHDAVIAEPHVLEIELASRGRRDIPSSAFDGGEPIRLDVGTPIVALLQVTSEPAFLTFPKVAVEGTSLNIGPSLIGPRQKVVLIALIKGGSPRLSWRSSLEGVTVKQQKASQGPGSVFFIGIASGTALIACAASFAAAAVGTKLMSIPAGATALETGRAAFETIAITTALVALAGWVAYVLRKRKERD